MTDTPENSNNKKSETDSISTIEKAKSILGLILTITPFYIFVFNDFSINGEKKKECYSSLDTILNIVLHQRNDLRLIKTSTNTLEIEKAKLRIAERKINKENLSKQLEEICIDLSPIPVRKLEPIGDESILIAVGRIQGSILRWKSIKKTMDKLRKYIILTAFLGLIIGLISLFVQLSGSSDIIEEFSKKAPVYINVICKLVFSKPFLIILFGVIMTGILLYNDLENTSATMESDIEHRYLILDLINLD